MFKFYNFHFKGKINEQAMSNNLIMKLQGCWGRGGVPAPLLEETLQMPSRAPPHPTAPPAPPAKVRGRGWPPGGAPGQLCREAVPPSLECGSSSPVQPSSPKTRRSVDTVPHPPGATLSAIRKESQRGGQGGRCVLVVTKLKPRIFRRAPDCPALVAPMSE